MKKEDKSLLMDMQNERDQQERTNHDEGGKNQHQPVEAAARESEELGQLGPGPLHHLRQNLSAFSPAERQIGAYVLEHPRQVLRLPTDQLAREIGVSQGTLSNFSQALGYSGFKAFRLALAAPVNAPLHLYHAAIARGDTLLDIANKPISAAIDSLLPTLPTPRPGYMGPTVAALSQPHA